MPIIHSHTNRKRRYIDKCKTFNIYFTNVNQDYNFDIQIQTTLSYIEKHKTIMFIILLMVISIKEL